MCFPKPKPPKNGEKNSGEEVSRSGGAKMRADLKAENFLFGHLKVQWDVVESLPPPG